MTSKKKRSTFEKALLCVFKELELNNSTKRAGDAAYTWIGIKPCSTPHNSEHCPK